MVGLFVQRIIIINDDEQLKFSNKSFELQHSNRAQSGMTLKTSTGAGVIDDNNEDVESSIVVIRVELGRNRLRRK